MNVLILSSASEDIDPYYLSVARSVTSFLANNECDLVYGGGDTSMMGICYDEFSSKEREIYAFTTTKYIECFKNLPLAKHYYCKSTLELKERMLNNSDLIVCLPGGIGTYSELLSYIEEKRSNDIDIPIIIYDEDNFYKDLFNIMDKLIETGFVKKDVLNNFVVAHNKDEFINAYYDSKRRVK